MRLREFERFLYDLNAFALQHVRKTRVLFEMGVIERGDQLVLATVPVMEQRRDDAARLELLVKADALEQLQRGGMVCARARYLFEEIVRAEHLDEAHLGARLRQCQRQTQPHRSGTDDDHAVGGVHASALQVPRARLLPALREHSARRQLFAATTSFTAPTQPVWVRSNTMPSGSLYLAS